MQIEAIILKLKPSREADLLVTAFTPDTGKQTYVARGALNATSKQARHIDLLNLVSFTPVEGNGHPIMASVHTLKQWPALKSNLSTLATAYFFLECFDKLVFENDHDPDLWLLIKDLVIELNDAVGANNADVRNIMDRRYAQLVRVMGYDESVTVADLTHHKFSSIGFLSRYVNI